jgi:hypothetical protein
MIAPREDGCLQSWSRDRDVRLTLRNPNRWALAKAHKVIKPASMKSDDAPPMRPSGLDGRRSALS